MEHVPKTRIISEDQAAANAGEWVRAVTLKMVAIWDAALLELEAEGILGEEVLRFHWMPDDYEGPPGAIWDAFIEDDVGSATFVAGAGLRFIETRPAPSEPWPAPYFAAVQVVYLWWVLQRFRRVRRRAIQGIVDANEIGELVWLSLHIGAYSEGFRPGYAAMCEALADARRQLEGHRAGGRIGGGIGAEKADARWRSAALEFARRERARQPHLGQKELAKRICEKFPEAPDRDQVVTYLRSCERGHELERSTLNRSKLGRES